MYVIFNPNSTVKKIKCRFSVLFKKIWKGGNKIIINHFSLMDFIGYFFILYKSYNVEYISFSNHEI